MQKYISTHDGDKADPISHRVQTASTSVHHAIDRATDAAGPVIDRVATAAHQTTDQVAVTAADAARALRSANARIWAAQRRLTQNGSRHIREKPMASLGIAAAGGFLLGLLLALAYERVDRG
ncbi:MAG: hypothetical protein ABIR55_08750 [Burkholderiaceae bacterium]